MRISNLEFIETKPIAFSLSSPQGINGGRRNGRLNRSPVAVVGKAEALGTIVAAAVISTAIYTFDFG